jgi:hypothetical protein
MTLEARSIVGMPTDEAGAIDVAWGRAQLATG